jgi:fluoride exporter
MQHSLTIYGYIAVGGAVGACLRFFLSQIMLQWFGKGFPFGTLLVNVVGSLCIGIVYTLIEQEQIEIVLWRTTVAIGFLGALTTFSTFSLDSLLLFQQGMWLKGMLNIFLNLTCCLLAAWLGTTIVKG